MLKTLAGKKGVVLLIVLAMVMTTVVLAGVILSIVSNQYRLTHHKVNRIQAYYADLAGMNLAFEKLMTGVWTTGTYSLCKSGCDVDDYDIPFRVDITISDPDASGIRTVSLTSDYTYTP